MTRPSRQADGRPLELGVQEYRYQGQNAHLVGGLAYYIRLGGELLTSPGYNTLASLLRRGDQFAWWHNLPDEFSAYLELDQTRVPLTAEQQRRLEAEMARVADLPLGQAVAALRAQQQAADAQRTAEAHARLAVHRERLQARGVPWLMGNELGDSDSVYSLGYAYEMTPQEQAADQAWLGRRVDPWYAEARHPLPLLLLPHLDAEVAALAPQAGPITQEAWDALKALSASRVAARAAREAAEEALETAQREAVFERARKTGERQMLSSWLGEDDSIPDSSLSEFILWALPDGTTTTQRRPCH
ncbi:hypothetical protein [Deinococcus multiflagellatus]|uniref:Uncharacterized protein n=1 Tax=Deinococcus multiflagellatus TaxID=1656887 RepID=A0ABW1ZPL5_9DEIO